MIGVNRPSSVVRGWPVAKETAIILSGDDIDAKGRIDEGGFARDGTIEEVSRQKKIVLDPRE
jgi:hypothetical protein